MEAEKPIYFWERISLSVYIRIAGGGCGGGQRFPPSFSFYSVHQRKILSVENVLNLLTILDLFPICASKNPEG